MLMYHLFFAVKNSKNSYTETKCFQFKHDALQEAIQLSQASNVKFISIREVEVTSISLDIIKNDCEDSYADKSKQKACTGRQKTVRTF